MLNKNWKPEVVIVSMGVVQFETLITVDEIYFYEKKRMNPPLCFSTFWDPGSR